MTVPVWMPAVLPAVVPAAFAVPATAGRHAAGLGAAGRLWHLTNRQVADFVTAPLRIGLVVVLAVVIRALAARGIDRLVRSAVQGRVSRQLAALGDRAQLDSTPLAAERRTQRTQTVAGVLKSVLNILIVTIAGITILGEIGVNLAPILASAGIVGVAVGFGAQSLVRDFFAGLFLILEDQFGVGDVVEVNGVTGVVETVSLRTTRLRDVTGTLWHLRNGEVTKVGNHSMHWQRTLLDFAVPIGTDLAGAEQLLLERARAVVSEPDWEGVLLDPPSVWGVTDASGTATVLRLAVRRRPGYDALDRGLRGALLVALEQAGLRVPGGPTEVRLLASAEQSAVPATPRTTAPGQRAVGRDTPEDDGPAAGRRARRRPSPR